MEASKSLILGNILGFLQQYINQIVQVFFPDWELEFIGYEFKDPKAIVDLAKSELESYKTLNEVRKEKGLPALKSKFADECPANPQLVQLYQSEQAQSQGGDMGDFGGGDFGEEPQEGTDGEKTTDDNANVDADTWGEIKPDNADGTENNATAESEQKSDESQNIQKSLNSVFVINL
jgi:hypothetical protein